MKKAVPFLLLAILFAFAAWYSLVREPEPVHEVPPPSLSFEPAVEVLPPEPTPVVTVDEEVTPEPEPLPLLHESDEEITDAFSGLVGEQARAQYLVKDQVVSRLVAAIDALDSRQVSPQVNPFKGAEGQFMVDAIGESVVISAENSARYDAHVALLAGLDSTTLVWLYEHYYPLLQQAWEENGGQGPFKARLLEIIDHLLMTPEIEGGIQLVKPEAVYLFEDPELEALTAGQKILLRLGPDNATVVRVKLEEIRPLLGE